MKQSNFYPKANVMLASKNNKKFKEDVETVIIHGTGSNNSAKSIVDYLLKPKTASAHIVIGRDGQVFQLVPFNVIAWHAGHSVWDGKKWLNNRSIGIELCNSLKLVKTKNGFQDQYNHNVPDSEVYEWEGDYWQLYTEDQYLALHELLTFLTMKFGILELLGHEQVSPGRKIDPGPAFHWHFFRKDNL